MFFFKFCHRFNSLWYYCIIFLWYFKNYNKNDLDNLINKLNDGQTISDLTSNLKFYDYYFESYSAVLGEFIGEYSVEVENSN